MYFQYDMGTAETVSKTVDALLSDWAQIVHLYTVVEDLAEYFRIGECILKFFTPYPIIIKNTIHFTNFGHTFTVFLPVGH